MTKSAKDPGFAPIWCVHFQSMAQHKTCKAEVDYTALNGGTEYRRMYQLPCFIKAGEKPGVRLNCDHFLAPTEEEVAQHRQWAEDRESLVKTVKAGISRWRVQHQGCSHTETVVCPACKGHLHLSIAAHNGHVKGRCETGGCVSWAE